MEKRSIRIKYFLASNVEKYVFEIYKIFRSYRMKWRYARTFSSTIHICVCIYELIPVKELIASCSTRWRGVKKRVNRFVCYTFREI